MAKAEDQRPRATRRDQMRKAPAETRATWSSPVIHSLEAGSEASSSPMSAKAAARPSRRASRHPGPRS